MNLPGHDFYLASLPDRSIGALSLLWAGLDRAVGGWRGVTYTPADVRLLQTIRRNLGLTPSRREQPELDYHGDVPDV